MVIQGVGEGEEVIMCVKDCHPILEVLMNRMTVWEMFFFLNECSKWEVRP